MQTGSLLTSSLGRSFKKADTYTLKRNMLNMINIEIHFGLIIIHLQNEKTLYKTS